MITNIKLKNFKIFEDQSFEIAPFTLITGINGMGKSSIIQSLLLLKQSYEVSYLQNQGKVDLDNDFINLETAEDLCYEKADIGNKNVDITLVRNNTQLYNWSIDASFPRGKVLDCKYAGDNDFHKLPLFSNNFIYLNAERWGPREAYYRKEKRAYNTKLGIQGELTPAYLADAIYNNERLGINEMKHSSLKKSYEVYENLNAWMAEILGVGLKAKVSDIDQERVKLTYNLEGSQGGTYSALQVGFGFTYCLPVILAALIAKKGDLVIVENPEAHLHPAAQVKIGTLLALAARNGVQIIVESHSDHVLNSIRYAYREGILNNDLLKVVFVTSVKSKDEVVPYPDYVKILDKGKLSHRPNGFFDEWDNMLTKLL